jgi:8-oxo-dGTP pyrophosphatase MutT (NUDIX family)
VKDGEILIGRRRDGTGWCGPGGGIEDGETPEQAARRELNEEFGIKANEMIPVGVMNGLPERYGVPFIFLCTDYDGIPKCDGKEMEDARFCKLDELPEFHLFPPFMKSVSMLLKELRRKDE